MSGAVLAAPRAREVTPAEAQRALARLGEGLDAIGTAELLRTVQRRELALFLLPQGAPTAPLRNIERRGCRAVLALQDTAATGGPAAFPAALPALRWASAIVVDAAGGALEARLALRRLAVRWGRAVLVETTPGRAQAWAALIAGATAPRLPDGFVFAPGRPPIPFAEVVERIRASRRGCAGAAPAPALLPALRHEAPARHGFTMRLVS